MSKLIDLFSVNETEKTEAVAICFVLDDPYFFPISMQKTFIRSYCKRMYDEPFNLQYRVFSRNMMKYDSVTDFVDPSEVVPLSESPIMVDEKGKLHSTFLGCGDEELQEAEIIIFSSLEILGYLPETAWDAYVVLSETPEIDKAILFARSPEFNLYEQYAPKKKESGISEQRMLRHKLYAAYRPILLDRPSEIPHEKDILDQIAFENAITIDEVEGYGKAAIKGKARKKPGRSEGSVVFNRETTSRLKYVLFHSKKKLFGNETISDIAETLSKGNHELRLEIYYGSYQETNPQTEYSTEEVKELAKSTPPHEITASESTIKRDRIKLLDIYTDKNGSLDLILGYLDEQNLYYEADMMASDLRKKESDVIRRRKERKGDEADLDVDYSPLFNKTKISKKEKKRIIEYYEDYWAKREAAKKKQ